MAEVGVPTPEEVVTGHMVYNALLDDTGRLAAHWTPVYEVVVELGVWDAFTDGARQAFCGELCAGVSLRPPSGFAKYSPPKSPLPDPPPDPPPA